jgi:predicted signal transduction protein with EAL and GGDEF domain
VAERLTGALRVGDILARVGGDKFGLLVPELGPAGGAEIDELGAAIAEVMREPFSLRHERLFVSVSMGTVIAPGPGVSKAELLRKADIALHQAKAKGGRRNELFAEDMDELVRQRHKIERDLRHALATATGLRVVFQPLYTADGRTMVGAEALVRWDHPVHGNLAPDVFVAVAEQSGLIDGLTARVIEDACIALDRTALPWISVNVSPVQLHNSGFAATVLAALAAHRLPPHRLQVEITETALIEDGDKVRDTLDALRGAGIVIALDDFGTGYSSMNYLRDYPVDKIKIDKSFVRQLGDTEEADAIVAAIVALARAMKKRVVAEGIETQEQQEHLAALGCHELQGFFFSRPLSKDELAELAFSSHRPPDRGPRLVAHS